MEFHKNGKHWFTTDKKYIISRNFGGAWGIYQLTNIPGLYEIVCCYDRLKDAKAEVERRYK